MLLSAPHSPTDAHYGSLDMTLADRDGRTRLALASTRPPLQVQQVLYPDPALPHLALVMVANPTGGIFQGDRHRIAVNVESGAAAHITGQGATRIHSMPHGSARQEVALSVAEGGYLEYLPDPLIPYRDSDFEQRITLSAAPGGSLVYWDIITPGRVAMGESFRYRRLGCTLEVMGPRGLPAYRESFILEPANGLPLAREVLSEKGDAARSCTLGSMLVITDGPELGPLLTELQELSPTLPGVTTGATLLPDKVGVAVRALGGDASAVRDALTQCWMVVRNRLLGCPAPFLRKY